MSIISACAVKVTEKTSVSIKRKRKVLTVNFIYTSLIVNVKTAEHLCSAAKECQLVGILYMNTSCIVITVKLHHGIVLVAIFAYEIKLVCISGTIS